MCIAVIGVGLQNSCMCIQSYAATVPRYTVSYRECYTVAIGPPPWPIHVHVVIVKTYYPPSRMRILYAGETSYSY